MRLARNNALFSLLLGFVLLSIIAWPTGAIADMPKRSKISIPEPTFDFGVVSQGTEVEHDFVVRNDGDANLVIQRVHAACGCTATAPSKNVVLPGETAKINVKFDTSGFSGEKLKTVRVYTTDMDTPSSVLTLRGTVEPDVLIEPKRVLFDDIFRGASQAAPIEVDIRVREGSKSAITSIRNFSQWVNLKEITSGTKERRVEVSIRPDAPVGELRDRIVVGITGSRQSSINIPILGVVSGAVVATPSVVSMGIIEGDAPIERAVKIENKAKKPFKVIEARSAHPAISTKVSAIGDGSIQVVTIIVDPKKITGDLRSSVRISTSQEDQPALTVSVYGTLPPRV